MTNPNDTDNRRRFERHYFQRECRIEPRSPAWTMLPDPLKGETVNITEHGIRVQITEFPAHRHETWLKCLERGDTIGVMIHVSQGDRKLELPGQIVWMLFEPTSNGLGDCSIGVLLSILDETMRDQLQGLINHLGD